MTVIMLGVLLTGKIISAEYRNEYSQSPSVESKWYLSDANAGLVAFFCNQTHSPSVIDSIV